MAYNIDEQLENADWPKRTWTLPPYKSEEFMARLSSWGMTLDGFRSLPIFAAAVESGLIDNDEWVGPRRAEET